MLVPRPRRKLAQSPAADALDAGADGDQPGDRHRREDPRDDGLPRRHRAIAPHSSGPRDFDFRTAASGSVGFGPWSASASVSVGYVNSTRTQCESELNVAADLTGEVEIHFRSDVFQLKRFVDEGADGIRANTPVPEANEPPWGDEHAECDAVTPAPRRRHRSDRSGDARRSRRRP